MATYKTPGVYVEEISTLPPSVAAVSTAVPAFIGYTAGGPAASKDPKVARIDTLLEYESIFGRANPSKFTIKTSVDPDTDIEEVAAVKRDTSTTEFLMHYCLRMYFNNGGGSCYIISIGNYADTPAKDRFIKGLEALEKEDEPTLILLTDAVNLGTAQDAYTDYYTLCQQALDQCKKLGDRFTILDVKNGNVGPFRGTPEKAAIVASNLMYGAAYMPYLRTSLNYRYLVEEVTIKRDQAPTELAADPTTFNWEKAFGEKGILVSYTGSEGDTPAVQIKKGSDSSDLEFSVEEAARKLTIGNVSKKTGDQVVTAWNSWEEAGNDPHGFEIKENDDGTGEVESTGASSEELPQMTAPPVSEKTEETSTVTLESIKSTETALFNQIKAALTGERVVLPPSAAVAGIYARVDRERGVWKAPANVSLSAVIGPVKKITHEEQEGLNVDPTAGKSINAIRQFTGKGTLVWGARTLAGNDNEWRYVSVRRLFNMIEESTQKATAFAVFEPNDATTWLKVKAMIESYLYGLWEQGALAGPTSESAYFVNVGLGKTMTTQDVLEGRMIVEIGVAAVRPAEFIILRFTHKMQEA